MSRASRKKANQAATNRPAAAAAEPTKNKPVTYVRDEPFIDVEDFEVGYADEKQLRLLVKDWRKGRATETIWDMITDGYVTLFSLAVVIAMVVSGLLSVQKTAAGCNDVGCVTSRQLLPWLALGGIVLITLSAARLFGPVIASAAEGFWLFDAPLSRAKFLRRRLVGVLILSFLVGAVLNVLVSMFIGADITAIINWSLGAGFAAAAATGFSAVLQATQKRWIGQIVQTIFSLLCLALLIVVILVATGKATFAIDVQHVGRAGYWVIGISVVALILMVIFANLTLENMRRARLVSGGNLISGMQGAMFALDFGLMRDILIERKWADKGHVRPTMGRATGASALVWRDFERLIRTPRNPIVLLITTPVVYAFLSLGLGNLTTTLSAIVLMFALVPLFDSLRVVNRTRGLARCFPMSTSQLNGALTTVPAALALIWAVLVAPAYMLIGASGSAYDSSVIIDAVAKGMVTAIAGYVAAIRWVSAKSADYSSPMVATGFGATPPNLMFNLIRGFDMIALITLPILVGWPYWISIVLAIICYMVLRSGGMNTEEMMERNKEAQEELKAMREGRNVGQKKEKIVIQRKSRRTRP